MRGPIDGASARWVTIELLSLLRVAPGSRATRFQRGRSGVASSGRAADRRTRLRGGLGGREPVRGPIDGASARWVRIVLLSLLRVAPGSRSTRFQRGKAGVSSSGRAADRRNPSSGSERSGGVWKTTRPDAAWRHFVLIGRFPALLMPTDGAPQGPILAWCAARRRNELRPPRGLDRARAFDRGRDSRRDFDKTNPSASVHAPPTPHTTHLTQSTDSTRSGSG